MKPSSKPVTWYWPAPVGMLLFLAGVALMISSPLVGALMLVEWLKFGEWPPWTPAGLGVAPPVTSLLGLNKILAWLYDQPAAVLAFALGCVLLWLGTWLTDDRPKPVEATEGN